MAQGLSPIRITGCPSARRSKKRDTVKEALAAASVMVSAILFDRPVTIVTIKLNSTAREHFNWSNNRCFHVFGLAASISEN